MGMFCNDSAYVEGGPYGYDWWRAISLLRYLMLVYLGANVDVVAGYGYRCMSTKLPYFSCVAFFGLCEGHLEWLVTLPVLRKPKELWVAVRVDLFRELAKNPRSTTDFELYRPYVDTNEFIPSLELVDDLSLSSIFFSFCSSFGSKIEVSPIGILPSLFCILATTSTLVILATSWLISD